MRSKSLRYVAKGGAENAGGVSYILHSYFRGEDYTIRNNSIVDIQGNGQGLFAYWQGSIYGYMEGLAFLNNIYVPGASAASNSHCLSSTASGPGGTTAIPLITPYSAGNKIGGSACASPLSNSGDYSGIADVSSTTQSDFKFFNPARRDYRLRHDSPFISGGASRGTDGRDVGVDMDLLESKQGIVKNVRA